MQRVGGPGHGVCVGTHSGLGAVYQPCVLTATGEYISLMKRPGGRGRGRKSARGVPSALMLLPR